MQITYDAKNDLLYIRPTSHSVAQRAIVCVLRFWRRQNTGIQRASRQLST